MEAMRIVNDFQQHPCKLDVQWFMHLLEFPSVQDLMSEQSLAVISTRADEIEFDNWGVESRNDNCHRTVRRACQPNLASVLDVSSCSGLRQNRYIHTSIAGGDYAYPVDFEKARVFCKEKRLVEEGSAEHSFRTLAKRVWTTRCRSHHDCF